jgi:bifunctional non-homologous end joining protein LigD
MLWPGITKRDLAEYWRAVAAAALPEIAARPLAVVRCPGGIDGPHFFQKHAHAGLPAAVRAGQAQGHPYLAIDGADGLVAMAQIAAVELHAWGATEADPAHPDRLVFDLDPGAGVPFAAVVAAAQDLRRRLHRLGLVAFCRTTGGKGLHLVVPLVPQAEWDAVHDFCRGFATLTAHDAPDRFVATVAKTARTGRILIDWLRNGPGATAVASFSPRARPGATVATRLAWREVTARLDPATFTLRTVPGRLARQRRDPWAAFATAAARLPPLDNPAAAAEAR